MTQQSEQKVSRREIWMSLGFLTVFMIWIGSSNTTYDFFVGYTSATITEILFGGMFTLTPLLALYVIQRPRITWDNLFGYAIFLFIFTTGIYYLYLALF